MGHVLQDRKAKELAGEKRDYGALDIEIEFKCESESSK